MRIIDCISSPTSPLFKHLLVEDLGEFSLLCQAAGQNTKTTGEHLSEEVAFVVWRKILIATFYATNQNPSDSTRMAEHRLQTLH